MTETSWTPGPWKREVKGRGLVVMLPDGRSLTGGVEGNPKDEAIITLIAAAPALAETLQAIVALLTQPVQTSGLKEPTTCDILRGDAAAAVGFAISALRAARGETT